MSDNQDFFTFDQILTHIIHENNDYYAYIPDNHVIVPGRNNKYHTINKLKLDNQTESCTIKIGHIDFYCELLTRDTDNSVLLRVEYYEDSDEKCVYLQQQRKLSKHVESLLLGFNNYGKQYENNPDDFYSGDSINSTNETWN